MIIYGTYYDSSNDTTYHLVDIVEKNDPIFHEHVYIQATVVDSSSTLCYGIDCTDCLLTTSTNCSMFTDNLAVMGKKYFPIFCASHPELFV